MNDSLVPHAFFTVRIKTDIAGNPFVIKKVIPALEKTHPKQVALLKQKYRKIYSAQGFSEIELMKWIWFGIIKDMVGHYSSLLGKDRDLSFLIFSGGADQFIIWDNNSKSLYPSNEFSFCLPFSSDPNAIAFEQDNAVFLKGKLSSSIRNGQRYAVLKVYFHVVDSLERRNPGETTISKNVGMLCEVPFFFLRNDRYETFQNAEKTSQLLELFGLKKENGYIPDLDFIPTDELGESYGYSSVTEIGNDYVGISIR